MNTQMVPQGYRFGTIFSECTVERGPTTQNPLDTDRFQEVRCTEVKLLI